MISVVVYGRNDDYGYNLHKRAAISLNCIAAGIGRRSHASSSRTRSHWLVVSTRSRTAASGCCTSWWTATNTKPRHRHRSDCR